MEAGYFLAQQQLVARMVEALTDARATITVDRDSLHDSTVQADGTVADDDRGPLDEYDRVLDLVAAALDLAKGVK